MRELVPNDKNEFIISDQTSGTLIPYFYRSPVSSDRLKYKSMIVNMVSEGNTPQEIQGAQLDYVLEFIVGFGEDAFTVNGKVISSDKNSKNHYEGWKAVIRENASDHLLAICRSLFDEPSFLVKKNSPLVQKLMQQKTPGPKKRKKNT